MTVVRLDGAREWQLSDDQRGAEQAQPEERLKGGNVNSVVRVGSTVRRPTGPWSRNVHALLAHLKTVGFELAPQPLGTDEQGREVLSFMEGHPGTYPDGWPFEDNDLMVEIGRILRLYHDATIDFTPLDDNWQYQVGAPRSGEVICHNDFAPYNMLFNEEGRPVAVIDWDLAAPAPREWDLAHAAWRFVPMYPPEQWWMGGLAEFPLERRGARMQALCDGYGYTAYAELLDLIEERQRVVFHTVRTLAMQGVPGYIELWNGQDDENSFKELAYFRSIKEDLRQHLT